MTRRLCPAAIAVLLSLVAPTAGCEGGAAEPPPDGETASYRVRGVVRAVGENSLQIRHQAIPDFRDPSGDVVGMEAMSMDFALAAGVVTDELNSGDKVEFELSVDWDAPRPAVITALEELPRDTPLVF